MLFLMTILAMTVAQGVRRNYCVEFCRLEISERLPNLAQTCKCSNYYKPLADNLNYDARPYSYEPIEKVIYFTQPLQLTNNSDSKPNNNKQVIQDTIDLTDTNPDNYMKFYNENINFNPENIINDKHSGPSWYLDISVHEDPSQYNDDSLIDEKEELSDRTSKDCLDLHVFIESRKKASSNTHSENKDFGFEFLVEINKKCKRDNKENAPEHIDIPNSTSKSQYFASDSNESNTVKKGAEETNKYIIKSATRTTPFKRVSESSAIELSRDRSQEYILPDTDQVPQERKELPQERKYSNNSGIASSENNDDVLSMISSSTESTPILDVGATTIATESVIAANADIFEDQISSNNTRRINNVTHDISFNKISLSIDNVTPSKDNFSQIINFTPSIDSITQSIYGSHDTNNFTLSMNYVRPSVINITHDINNVTPSIDNITQMINATHDINNITPNVIIKVTPIVNNVTSSINNITIINNDTHIINNVTPNVNNVTQNMIVVQNTNNDTPSTHGITQSVYNNSLINDNTVIGSQEKVRSDVVKSSTTGNRPQYKEGEYEIPKIVTTELSDDTVTSEIKGKEEIPNADFKTNLRRKTTDQLNNASLHNDEEVVEINDRVNLSGKLYYKNEDNYVPVQFKQNPNGQLDVVMDLLPLCDLNKIKFMSLLKAICDCLYVKNDKNRI